MPHISALKSSNFLTKDDVGPGVLLTIKDCVQSNVAKEGAPEEMKWCLTFMETEKPCVLNSTNGQIIAQFTGQEDTDHWRGSKVVLYHDKNITFGGKLVGGIRARAPKTAKPAQPQQPPPVAHAPTTLPPATALPPADEPADDVPF